jgi:hypothetical protein
MNISLIILTAIISTIGIILITEYAGRKRASSLKKLLGFLAIAPFLSILIKLLFAMLTNIDNAGAVSSTAADEMTTMLPEMIFSGYIGDFVGLILWGIYRWVKRHI